MVLKSVGGDYDDYFCNRCNWIIVSIIRENKQSEQKWSSNKSIWDQLGEE